MDPSDQIQEVLILEVEPEIEDQSDSQVISNSSITITPIKNLKNNDSVKFNNKLCYSLSDNLEFWENTKDDFVINIIKNGVKLIFKKGSQRIINNKLSSFIRVKNKLQDYELILNEINDMLNLGIISEINDNIPRYFSNIFLVKRDSLTSRNRPIINLKPLNKHLITEKFKMSSFKDVLSIISKNNFVTKIDLTKAYYHIKLNEVSKRYICFCFDNRKFQYESLPFGLKSAPFIFHRVMNSALSFIRSKYNIIIISYLDDILIISKDFDNSIKDTEIVVNSLKNFGWQLNEDKSILKPSRLFDFLGVEFDLDKFIYGPSKNNLNKCINKVNKFLVKEKISCRELESLVGSLNFISQLIQQGRAMLHPIIAYKINNFNINERDSYLDFSQDLKNLLKWWILVKNYSPSHISLDLPAVSAFSDASLSGWGATLQIKEEILHFQGKWEKNQKFHINTLELLAVLQFLNQAAHLLRSKVVNLYLDNMTAVSVLKKKGTHRSMLRQEIFLKIQKIVLQENIFLNPKFIQGKINVSADVLSRSHQSLPMEIQISQRMFNWIQEKLQLKIQIDLFASHQNTKCPLFFSAIPDPQAKAIDALQQDWTPYKILYAFPPPALIPKILFKWSRMPVGHHLILITPAWKTKFWYPAVLQRSQKTFQLPLEMEDLFVKIQNQIISVESSKFYLTVHLL